MENELSNHSKGINILLVDDDEVDIMNVKRAFKRGGISNPVWTANNGIEGLAALRGPQYPKERRLVLLDINMPRMSGIEMLREVRADPVLQMTSIVMLTTSNDDRDRIESYRLNVAGYLLKPVTFSDFVTLMATMQRYWMLVEMP